MSNKKDRLLLMAIEAKELHEKFRVLTDRRHKVYCLKHKSMVTLSIDGGHDCEGFIELLVKVRNSTIGEIGGVEGYNYEAEDKIYENEMCGFKSWIGMPSQEDLQEIYNFKTYQVGYFSNWVHSKNYLIYNKKEKWRIFDNMAELWFAFVMYEKFNKTWDDKKNKWYQIPITMEV